MGMPKQGDAIAVTYGRGKERTYTALDTVLVPVAEQDAYPLKGDRLLKGVALKSNIAIAAHGKDGNGRDVG